ncbi:MAG: XdhC/CoxI family protein [Pirellulales bacterium]
MATLPLNNDVPRTILEAIDENRPFALAVVMKSSGSVPREAGTKALIDQNGTIDGTIGGGLLEAEAQRLAIKSLKTKRPTIFDFRFAGANAELNDPVCGGTMRVLVDPDVARNRAGYAAAAEAVRRRQRGMLLTTVNGDRAAPQVSVDWIARDSLPPAEWQALKEHGDDVLAEPVVPAARLLIAGGGHVGQALARQASLVGFEVIVVEDRAEFVDPARYLPDVTTRCGAFSDALAEFPIDEDTYVAIVGRGHRVDMQALTACLNSPAAYIGMMGSRRKVALVRNAFLESGQATEEQFARVYAPIGINLGAETVPEIAASIVAQLVAVRRTGRAPRFE